MCDALGLENKLGVSELWMLSRMARLCFRRWESKVGVTEVMDLLRLFLEVLLRLISLMVEGGCIEFRLWLGSLGW